LARCFLLERSGNQLAQTQEEIMHSRLGIVVALGLIASLFVSSLSAVAQDDFEYYPIATDEFETVWERTDYPVQQLEVARTWVWSPGGFTDAIIEDYAEGEDGERLVQYFDKSRMEMPTLGAADPEDEESPWLITQGLLASELMTGRLQLGDDTFEQHQPSQRSAGGDPADVTAPTYAVMGEQMDRAPRTVEGPIVEHIDREGNITSDAARFAGYGVTDIDDAYTPVEGIDKNIASVFWDLMTSEGLVFEGGEFVEDQPIFLNPFYAVGYPLTDAFWADVMVRGVVQDVLIQCFERRCLTYTPDNPEGWETESGNIGQHYYNWRYQEIPAEEPPDVEPFFVIEPADAVNPFYEGEALVWQQAQIAYDVAVEYNVLPEGTTVEDIFDVLMGAYEQEEIEFGDFEAAVEFFVPGLSSAQLQLLFDAYAAAGINVHTVQAHFRANDAAGDHIDVPGGEFVTVITAEDETPITPDEVDIDANEGRAFITYTSIGLGTDTISVTVTVDGVEYQAEATKTWTEPDEPDNGNDNDDNDNNDNDNYDS
jgi:hypothetical protein